MRSIVRAYYRLRYLPRHLFMEFQRVFSELESITEAINTITEAINTLERSLNSISESAARNNAPMQERLQEDLQEREVRLGKMFSELRHEIEQSRDTGSVALLAFHRRVEAIESALHRSADVISDLTKFTKLQARIFPAWIWSPEASDQVRTVLSMLRPFAANGIDKVRVGRDHDGGYVMLDSFAEVTCAVSLGIADDASWDLDIADRGIRILQFDPSIAASPVTHPLITFEPIRVAPSDYAGAASLGSILQNRISDEEDTLLLKMDIEGAEWEVFVSLADSVLRRFRQIVCEFHGLDSLAEKQFGERAHAVFEKLTRYHFVCHIHGNNCGNFANVANIPVPESLEVTFASRAHFLPTETAETYPTKLDRPNQIGRADLYLGQFRFD